MKTYRDFIIEISQRMLDMINSAQTNKVNITHFKSKSKPQRKTDVPKSEAQLDNKAIKQGINDINSIAAKYSAYIEPHTIQDHIVDRFTRQKNKADREYNMEDIVVLFKGIEKNTKFFDDLGKISSRNGGYLNRRVSLVDTTRKVHVLVHVTKRGKKYQIVARSLMGHYSMSYINGQKRKGIPAYFTR